MKRVVSFLCVLACLVGLLGGFAPAKAAVTFMDTLWVDGESRHVSAFKVDGTHYFKLRDVAAAMSGSGKPFDVSWSDELQQISILPGRDYTPSAAADEAEPDFSRARLSSASVAFQGKSCTLTAYDVQKHYYFKLRDILQLLDAGTFWDERRERVIIDTSYPYIPEGYEYTPQKNTVILMYHNFSVDPPAASEAGEVTTAAQFEADIRALLASGYKATCLEDLYLGRTRADERYFIITCDDGYLSNYTLAYPIIKKLHVPMDIFINTDNLTLSHHFTLAQAAEMEDSGLVRIYSHYPVHEMLTQLDPAVIRDEIWRSQDMLESVLKRKHIYFFAYPHGMYNAATYKQVSRSGALLQLAQTHDDSMPHLLTRINVPYDSDILALARRAYKN